MVMISVSSLDGTVHASQYTRTALNYIVMWASMTTIKKYYFTLLVYDDDDDDDKQSIVT